jgi:hypothetical protein
MTKLINELSSTLQYWLKSYGFDASKPITEKQHDKINLVYLETPIICTVSLNHVVFTKELLESGALNQFAAHEFDDIFMVALQMRTRDPKKPMFELLLQHMALTEKLMEIARQELAPISFGCCNMPAALFRFFTTSELDSRKRQHDIEVYEYLEEKFNIIKGNKKSH